MPFSVGFDETRDADFGAGSKAYDNRGRLIQRQIPVRVLDFRLDERGRELVGSFHPDYIGRRLFINDIPSILLGDKTWYVTLRDTPGYWLTRWLVNANTLENIYQQYQEMKEASSVV